MKKIIWTVLFALVILTAGAFAEETVGYEAVYSSLNPVPEIAANVRPVVVQVVTYGQIWDPSTRETGEQKIGAGSGTFFRALEDEEGGYILTNYHVVEEGDSFRILWLDGTEMDTELVGYDNGTDIAVLRFLENPPENVRPIVMGDSDQLQIGEMSIVIGNPGSIDNTLFGTVTAGIISGLEREKISAGNFTRAVSVIQTDAAINQGCSGGALLNAKGELVGVPTLKLASETVEGLGFCVPINTVKGLIDQILTTGKVTRPMLGLGVADYDGPDEPMRNYPPIGVIVRQVMQGSSAQEQGVKLYDIITELDGVRITCYQELTTEIDKHQVGDVVTIKVYRYFDEQGNNLTRYEEYEFEIELREMED